MESRSAIYKKMLSILDQRRMNAQKQMHQRRDIIYKAVPEIEEIDRNINIMGMEAAKKTAMFPEESKKITDEFEKNKNKLIKRKKELLYLNGFNEDMLKIKYKCPKCNDTGFCDGKTCSCLAQLIMDEAYNVSGVGNSMETFDKFDFSYYSCEKEVTGISPRENIEFIYEKCQDFVEKMGKECINMLFYGNPGLGKTYLCGAIAKEVVKKGFTVMYVSATQLFKELEKERFNDDNYEGADPMEDILSADLLIIDDLGTELLTAFTISSLFNIINERGNLNKPIIISTNYMLENLTEMYGDRICSRIIGGYNVFKFLGDDIRILKKFRR